MAALWAVFEGLKYAHNQGAPIAWEPVLDWAEAVLPKDPDWLPEEQDHGGRRALVGALSLLAAGLNAQNDKQTQPPFRRLAALVSCLFRYAVDTPVAGASQWLAVDPAGASLHTIAGLGLFIGVQLAVVLPRLAPNVVDTDYGFKQRVLRQLDLLLLDLSPNTSFCRGQIGMWFADLLEWEPDWTAKRITEVFGEASSPADRSLVSWYGYVARASTRVRAVTVLECYYLAAIARVDQDEPPEWGEMKPSSQLGRLLINHFMRGHIDFNEKGLLQSFLARVTDDLRAHLAWIVGQWVRVPDADASSLERGMVYAETRLSEAEIADPAYFRRELDRFTIWLDAPLLSVQWKVGIVRRIAAIGMLGFGVFAVFQWLKAICDEHPDPALSIASTAILHPRAKWEAVYGSAAQIQSVLTSAIQKGSPETAQQAAELANALEVRGVTGMYDFVNELVRQRSQIASR